MEKPSMTKRQAREFHWFAQGFLKAATRLRDAARKQDPRWRTKYTHVTRGAWAASMLLERDFRRRQQRKGK
jgi:hypothetical protein